MRKENVKSLIILYTNSTIANNAVSDIQTRLKEERTSVCRSEIYGVTGRTNKTQLILQKIREHTFTTFIVMVSANETFSKFIADSLRQSKIRKIVFLCSKNKENYQPIGNVENLISVKTVNIKFGLFPTYILNALGKISDVLNSLSASSFRRRVVPKNVSTIFANSIREEGGFENVALKMFYQAKEKKLYGEYTTTEQVMKNLSGIQILPYGMKLFIIRRTALQVFIRFTKVLINVGGVAYYVKVGITKTSQAKVSVGCAIEVHL